MRFDRRGSTPASNRPGIGDDRLRCQSKVLKIEQRARHVICRRHQHQGIVSLSPQHTCHV